MEINKYIIKNCPAIYGIDAGFLCSYREDDESEKYCYDCTNCVMKQIVELCKEHPLCDCACGDEILKLLDIQEVE